MEGGSGRFREGLIQMFKSGYNILGQKDGLIWAV